MRVAEFYSLNLEQPSLPFLNVDIERDAKLFLSAKAIDNLDSEFGKHSNELLHDYFQQLLNSVKANKKSRALKLLSELREPNETHLGLSKGKSRGRGLGPQKASEIYSSFSKSKAVETGLLRDLEDTVLLIEGISTDILSDIITNVIRGPLITYTQKVCRQFDIPMAAEVSSGPVWNPKKHLWEVDFVELPVPNNEKLILVPKSIVRIDPDYDVSEYYRHYVLERLKSEELKKNTSLVNIIKTGKNRGKKKVYKTDLQAKYGTEAKSVSIEQTNNFPDVLTEYKKAKEIPTPALTHRQIADALDVEQPKWDELLESVMALSPGRPNAYKYEDAIRNLLTALFFPALVDPEVQSKLHNGMKRVDLTFTNYARSGFFNWLSRN